MTCLMRTQLKPILTFFNSWTSATLDLLSSWNQFKLISQKHLSIIFQVKNKSKILLKLLDLSLKACCTITKSQVLKSVFKKFKKANVMVYLLQDSLSQILIFHKDWPTDMNSTETLTIRPFTELCWKIKLKATSTIQTTKREAPYD